MTKVHAHHRTSAASAEAILRGGFKDAEGTWGTTEPRAGVWVTTERPWDVGITGLPPGVDPTLLVVEIPAGLFDQYEWLEEGKPYREALVPAELLNGYPVLVAW